MLKRVIIILLAVAMYMSAHAQQSPAGKDTVPDNKNHLRISLLTCSPGEEVYETFGHSCIRIIDSTKTGRERDVIYNYGFLESSPENPVWHQFLTGRALVFLATCTYDEFMFQYVDEKRGVIEQVFLLDNEQKGKILSYLQNNLRRENRYYEYNTFYDNCSTRILDMFVKTFGSSFVPGQVIPKDSRLTYRNLTAYLYYSHQQYKYWFEFVMKIFYASSADKIINNTDAMFLADYLCDGFAGATLDGKKLCGDKIDVLDCKIVWAQNINAPFIILLVICVLTIAGHLVKKLRFLGNMMSILVLLLSGAIGCCIFYLWSIDAEPAWKNNFNILWALPTNLVILFFGRWLKAKYAIAAISLIILSLVTDIFRIQELPLFEITPLLISLLFVYGMMYRKGSWKIKSV